MVKLLTRLLTLFTLIVFLILQLFPNLPTAYAALGWVGNMYPRPGNGSPTNLEVGSTAGLTVYVEAYKGGVTEPAGQGSGITCSLWWSDPATAPSWNAIAMNYVSDAGNNDTYSGVIATGTLPVGQYNYTARCSDDGGSNFYWQGDGNGVLNITPPGKPIFNLQPAPSSTTNRNTGDATPFNVSVDFYISGVTDSAGQGAGVTCVLWWDGYDADPDNDWNATNLTYSSDASNGSADRFSAAIDISAFPVGSYGLTARCNNGATEYWYGAHHSPSDATLVVGNAPPSKPIFNLLPSPGSTTNRISGDATPFAVSVDFYISGVTDSAGQGAGVTCVLWWDGSDGLPNGIWGATSLNYDSDVSNGFADRFTRSIDISAFPVGNYDLTARCNNGATEYWYGDHSSPANATLTIGNAPPSKPIFNLQPVPGTTTTRNSGDVTPFTVSVDFYISSVTDSAGQGSNVTCLLWWDGYDADPDGDWNATVLTYDSDVSNGFADRYSASINIAAFPAGSYGLTARCDNGATQYWYGDYHSPANATLQIVTVPTKPILNLLPAAGTTTSRTPGSATPVDFSVEFYFNGVTNSAGQGAGVTCVLWWDGYDAQPDNDWNATTLTYQADGSGGFTDRYGVSVNVSAFPDGSYGYTARCDYSGNQYWYGDHNTPTNGTLFIGSVLPPDIANLQPPTGSTTIIPLNDTNDVTLTVDFYFAGVTDADANAAGAGVTCQLWWDGYDSQPDNDWNATNMTYAGADNSGYDVFAYTITSAGTTLPAGSYGYTARCVYNAQTYWYGDFNSPSDGTLEVFEPSSITQRRALWVDRDNIAWKAAFSASIVDYQLLYDPAGSLTIPPTYNSANGIDLSANGTLDVNVYPKFPNGHTFPMFALPGTVTDTDLRDILRSEVAIAGYNSSGDLVEATGIQLQGVLDAFYSRAEVETYLGTRTLGVNYVGGAPQLHLWSPTAQDVDLYLYTSAANCPGGTPDQTVPMTFDAASGVWSVTGVAGWTYAFYRYQVDVYSPYTGVVENNLVTDPYSVSLSVNNFDLVNDEPLNDQCSQIVDVYNDPNLKPAGWDTLSKPSAITNAEDMTIYELHVRDFSIFDQSVTDPDDRGTYMAFTYDGVVNSLSEGMEHLIGLENAGLTHIHLLPVQDSGTMVERRDQQEQPDYAAMNAAVAADPASQLPQQEITNVRATDGFNWGYETQHFGAPEGAYSTDPNGYARIREFRAMVEALNRNGLRVVIDVVYNHTYRAGQNSGSVLDAVVPGYYQRLDANGNVMNSSCCPDTAAEFDMMEKLISDTVVLWAEVYKVDGFRFDLMNLMSRQNSINVRTALDALPNGSAIAMYGEGWDFGSLKDKGFGSHPDTDYRPATQFNMAGTEIGTFNDRLRDAVHGGGFFGDRREQGFTTGQYYDPNGETGSSQGTLRYQQDRLMVGMAGSIQGFTFTDRNNNVTNAVSFDSSGYALDPADTINYATKHDNETLFDLSAFKLNFPETPLSDYVRVQNLGVNVILLSQGVPFFDAGIDMMHSKSMDRNSYDSGDWFNRLDFTYSGNNFGVGVPPAWDNSSRWSIMEPRLRNTAIHPGATEIQRTVDNFREFLQIRYSSPLFRLQTGQDVMDRVQFYNTGSTSLDGLVVMSLSDGVGTDLDGSLEGIWVLVNANDQPQNFTVEQLINDLTMVMHPVLLGSTDPIVQTAGFDPITGTFSLPARTTAVFLTQQAPIPPSTIDYVGDMWNRGGSSQLYPVGTATTQTVYIQVYESGVTDAAGQGSGIDCFLHWGAFGDEANWTDTPMTYNVDTGNNDEYQGTIDIAPLGAATYGYTAYCKKTSEAAKKWRQNNLSLSPVDEGFGIIAVMPASAPPPGNVYVHLFEWQWTDIALECPYLAEAGYTAVQVSPPQEHVILNSVATDAWWTRYQPVSYILNSRSGSAAQFQSMINICNAAGVDIIVDAVINHMSGQESGGTGTNGTAFTHYTYPGVYDAGDFHYCGTTGINPSDTNNITSYTRRYEVQSCELLNLADLDTAADAVQADIQAYMQGLINMGVAGFRIDAAKHIFTHDITEILAGLTGDYYVFQEVIGSSGEPVQAGEYILNGDVTEFDYSRQIGSIFNQCGGNLSDLQNVATGKLPSDAAVVFTDNHDNQRGHGAGGACILDHRDGDDLYNLGNVFLLGYPYGYPQVMSSYWWDDGQAGADNYGPPATSVYSGGALTGCNSTDWVCEHRRVSIVGMVEFRAVTNGEPVTDWETISPNQIAFGRGATGFVAINRTDNPLTHTFQTSMLPGTYCDVLTGGLLPDGSACVGTMITVDATGQIVNQVVPGLLTANSDVSGFAIHARSLIGYVPPQIISTEPTEGGSIALTGGVITVTFNKPVNAAAGAFALLCNGQAIAVTINPALPATASTTFTLSPTGTLPNGAACRLTVLASAITDSLGANLDGDADGNDGDNFVLNFLASSSVVGGGGGGSGGSGGLSTGGEIAISNGDLILDAGEFIIVVPAANLNGRGRILLTVGGETEIMIIFRNPKSIPLNQVVISGTFDTRLDVKDIISASIGRTVLSGNGIYLDGFQLIPAQQGRMIVRIRVNNRAKPGDLIGVQAQLESPDASIHLSNLLEILVIPGELPATGESPVRPLRLLVLLSLLAAATFVSWRFWRLRLR